MPWTVEYKNRELGCSVVIDDDGKTIYAYLRDHERIVGDVWLSNCGPAPEKPEWRDKSKLPFCNPATFCVEDRRTVPEEYEELEVRWTSDGDRCRYAEIYHSEQRIALIAPGTKPGWSRNAAKDNSIAKRLEEGVESTLP